MTPREMLDQRYAGQPGWHQCAHCKHWYTPLGLERHKCSAAPLDKSPYDISCLTARRIRP